MQEGDADGGARDDARRGEGGGEEQAVEQVGLADVAPLVYMRRSGVAGVRRCGVREKRVRRRLR